MNWQFIQEVSEVKSFSYVGFLSNFTIVLEDFAQIYMQQIYFEKLITISFEQFIESQINLKMFHIGSLDLYVTLWLHEEQKHVYHPLVNDELGDLFIFILKHILTVKATAVELVAVSLTF